MSNNYDPMYNQGNTGWRQPSWNAVPNWQPQVNTNVAYVTGLDEALIKTNMRNSDMIYFDQDKNIFYRVKVDIEGRKTWAAFEYVVPKQEEEATPATKAEIAALVERIENLEQMLSAKSAKTASKRTKEKEIVDNGESDG